MQKFILAITGDIGSGKSTVSKNLAEKLGAKYYSAGEAQREIAKARGISTLELNYLAEKDPTIDQKIDSIFTRLLMTDRSLVVDARVAWHFIPSAIKVKHHI